MKLQHVMAVALLTIIFWLCELGLQTHVVINQLIHPEFLNDEMIGNFARRYLVTSSIKMLAFVGLGISLSWLVLIRKLAWAAVALGVLSAAVFWWWELSSIVSTFHPPLGDGSLGGAVAIWNKLHPTVFAWTRELLQIVFLVISAVFWPFAFDVLNDNQEYLPE